MHAQIGPAAPRVAPRAGPSEGVAVVNRGASVPARPVVVARFKKSGSLISSVVGVVRSAVSPLKHLSAPKPAPPAGTSVG
jgi:hypothetical protein